ncbi:MAG: DNA cytosine methyltransferase [Pseudomonadota bacterium]|nr:DNA cytosine methyltransferase [Pseudomonadota bacterium]
MGLIVDNFAGGGGASTGIEAALGRAVDIAINHDEQAIRMHEANHPGTLHIRNNIWQVDPRDVVKGRPVDLAWFSPDCKHFSKAKGGKPREKSIRDLAWVVVLWAQRVRPQVILLENVEEFRTWGPLCDDGKPIKERQGETFDKWCRELRKAGYKLQFRELRACDYGAPTIRKRFFMIARCDGEPIVWPEPTHAPADAEEREAWVRRQRKAGFKVSRPDTHKPWRTAAEIIDWSIPCPSIFERKKPLAEKTLRRIAHGIMKFAVNNPTPFIVPLTHAGSPGRSYGGGAPLPTVTGANRGELAVVSPHITKFRAGAVGHAADEPLHTVTANSYVKRPGGSAPLGRVDAVLAPFASYAQQGGANRSAEDPLHTVTASHKDHNTVATAVLVNTRNGERKGQAPRVRDVEDPTPTVTAKGSQGAVAVAKLMAAHIEQANGGPNNDKLAGRAAGDPISTIATKGSQQRLVTSNLVKLRGGEDSHDRSSSVGVDEPLHTVCATGTHMAEVRAFLVKYYGGESSDEGHGLENPLGTVTVQDRFGLVAVTIAGEEYVIVDIGMRMLTPRELFNAQGFPPDYIIDRDAAGDPITKTAQVAKCGNSVCPPLAEALVRANIAAGQQDERAAA